MQGTDSSAVSQLKAWVAAHREKLLDGKITTIIATYSGEGDQGWLDQEIQFLSDDGDPVKPFEPQTVQGLFEVLHDELAPSGYENDDGGGEFTLDVATGKLTHESYFLCTERSYNPAEEY